MKRQRIRRLALSYLAVIMTLSLVFSVIIYAITSVQLDRPLPPGERAQQPPELIERQFSRRLEQRNRETRGSVIMSLVVLNGVMLLVGYWLSLLLARRTLEPIERSIEQQAQFVSDASHELRTPLTALMTTNEVALRKKTLDDKKVRVVFQRNIDEVEKLRELTDNLLRLTQVDNQQIEKQAIDMAKFVRDTVDRYQPVANKKQVALDVQVPSVTHVVAVAAVTQILGTLIDNAIKYSPPGSTVVIRLDGQTLSVVDQGIGIAKQDQAKIFDRFYRSDEARTRGHNSGYGLGLAIAKVVADKNGYQLSVKSEPDQGSTFSLHF
ncbi:HAMP domain-containing histidine kinase [Candidatus Saccharibacteria bacterium oral taxon 488]|nr:HAMP domain-containing histidine kinase [Candidatus Saccharibacteria bacterium oral taxon 488]QLF52243.1 HAMP domain-containing histidine kinase [Candidatus Saccharibacteria bacterium oral taxon 488]